MCNWSLEKRNEQNFPTSAERHKFTDPGISVIPRQDNNSRNTLLGT